MQVGKGLAIVCHFLGIEIARHAKRPQNCQDIRVEHLITQIAHSRYLIRHFPVAKIRLLLYFIKQSLKNGLPNRGNYKLWEDFVFFNAERSVTKGHFAIGKLRLNKKLQLYVPLERDS